MNSDSGFIKRIPVEIQDVRFKSERNLAEPSRKPDDLMKHYLGAPYETAEGKPFSVKEDRPAATGQPGINPDPKPYDVGLVPGGI